MQGMTVRDLISQLEQFDPDCEVRIAQQPSWPFEYDIGEVTEVRIGEYADERPTAEDIEDPNELRTLQEDWDLAQEQAETVVYIPEADQIGCLPRRASRELGWR